MTTPTEVLEAIRPPGAAGQSALGAPSQGAVPERQVLMPLPQRVGRRELVNLSPHISGATDNSSKHIFPRGSPTQPGTAVLRRDASRGDLKAMLYMIDICTDIGLFAYPVGSHAVAPKGVADPIYETNDANGLAATDLVSRRIFAALPERLRLNRAVKTEWLTATEPVGALRDASWSITGHAGSLAASDTEGARHDDMAVEVEPCVMTCVVG